MEKKNNNGLLVGLLLGLVIAALVVGGLYVTGNINFKKTTTNNEQVSENNNTKEKNAIKNNENNEINKSTDGVEKQGSVNDNVNEVTFNNEKISVLDLTQEIIHISSGGVQSINPNYDYYIDLKLSGKVKIRTLGMSSQNSDESYEDFISNVSDVIDIIEFPVPAEPNEQIIYILQSNGDVYYYKVGDSKDKKYIATKVDNVSNVKKLFIYNYPTQKNAGGSWSIVAIKDNNETVALNRESV